VGKGSGNLTEAISAALRRDAVGPTGALIPETDLPPASRIGELGLDASGRLGYDEGHYALFGHLHFKGSTYTNAVAPTSYVGVGDNALASGGRGSEALFLHVDADEAAGAGGR
jgi:hypothetical protein